MVQMLIERCNSEGVTLRIVRGKVVTTPRPTEDLLSELKARRDEVVRHLCPPFKTDEEFADFTLKCAFSAMNIYPDLDFTPEMELVADGGSPCSLALSVADAVWKKEGR